MQPLALRFLPKPQSSGCTAKTNEWFTGLIDEVQVFTDAADEVQVANLFGGGGSASAEAAPIEVWPSNAPGGYCELSSATSWDCEITRPCATSCPHTLSTEADPASGPDGILKSDNHFYVQVAESEAMTERTVVFTATLTSDGWSG